MAENITLNNTAVATAKFVRNGVTTELTEIRYQKGASGTPVTVWTAQTAGTPYVSCTHSVVDRGSYYELTMVFTRTNTKFGNNTAVTVDSSGSLLMTSAAQNVLPYADGFIINFGSTGKTFTKVVNIQKSSIYTTGYAIKYTDSKAGSVTITGEFPLALLEMGLDGDAYISDISTSWVNNNGVESVKVDTTLYCWNGGYSRDILLKYYIDGEYSTSEIISNNLEFPTASKILTGWEGYSEITVSIAAIDIAGSAGYFLRPSADHINNYMTKTVDCVDTRSLNAPSMTITSTEANNVVVQVVNENSTYGQATLTLYKQGVYEKQFTNMAPGASASWTTTVEPGVETTFKLVCSKWGFESQEIVETFTLEPGDIDQDYKNWPRLLSVTASEMEVNGKVGTHLVPVFQRPSNGSVEVNLILEPNSGSPYEIDSVTVPSGSGTESSISMALSFWIPEKYVHPDGLYTLSIGSMKYTNESSNLPIEDVLVNDYDFYNEYFVKDFTCTSDTPLVAPEITLEYYEGDSSNFINVIATNKVSDEYCPVGMKIYAKYLTTDEDYTYEQYFPFAFVEYDETQEFEIEIGNYEGAEIMVQCYKNGFTSEPYTVETIGTLADGSNTESTRRE